MADYDTPVLTAEERAAVSGGRWFSSLSPALRHDILRCGYVRRYRDGELISLRGEEPRDWGAVAQGAVRVSSTAASGKQLTFGYFEPGTWFGHMAIIDGGRRAHDAVAHGDTTLLCVSVADFRQILAAHSELCQALLKLQARRLRQMYVMVEDIVALPLRARLAKQLLHLMRTYGVPFTPTGTEVRISLDLAQEEIAQLLGASRQRINFELKNMERQEVLRVQPTGIVIRDAEALAEISRSDEPSP